MSFISFRDSPYEFHITIGALREGDLQLFFGQSKFDNSTRSVHFHFETAQTWEDIAAFLQLQPSKSQARKNGWSGPIPWGYSEKHPKKWQHFYILNLDPNDPRTEALNE